MKSSIGSFLVMLFIGPGLLWVSEARAIPITTEVGNGVGKVNYSPGGRRVRHPVRVR